MILPCRTVPPAIESGGIRVDGATMFTVAEILSLPPARALLGTITQDRTGLTDRYTMELDYPFPPSPSAAPAAPPEFAGPSLSTAVREQWGLRLVPSKGRVKVIVVESAQLMGGSQGRLLARFDGNHERKRVFRISGLLQHRIEVDALPGQRRGDRRQDAGSVVHDKPQVVGTRRGGAPRAPAATPRCGRGSRCVSDSRSDTTATAVAGPPAPAPLKLFSPPYWPEMVTTLFAPMLQPEVRTAQHERRADEGVKAVALRLDHRDLPDGAAEAAARTGSRRPRSDGSTAAECPASRRCRRNAMPASTTSFAPASSPSMSALGSASA